MYVRCREVVYVSHHAPHVIRSTCGRSCMYVRCKACDTLVDTLRRQVVYMCGNSLGLLPKTGRQYVIEELDKWAKVDGDCITI